MDFRAPSYLGASAKTRMGQNIWFAIKNILMISLGAWLIAKGVGAQAGLSPGSWWSLQAYCSLQMHGGAMNSCFHGGREKEGRSRSQRSIGD